ncbi:MAG: 16S rRNA (adenine(1518)-N(6)/adenine(1519)-N(6))-dimethyltransferase RsmA [Buchnera aphidicola (Periphyllus acericola)]|nr:16S rRNA (adenine(1518)-N(6)/adenine(1519)-N(6))-dimethyltransferase RsmA [Buchnera aphidicola (Periphyllus acericola)]
MVLNNKFFQKKYFGQIFLKNTNVINNIISSIYPKKNDLLFEIGPGLGALTIPMCGFINKLNVIDIDNDVINFFKKKNIYNKLNFYLKNVLHFDFLKFYLKNNKKSIRIFGNLPYNISTKLLIYLTNNHFIFQDLHLMFQKEVSKRILAHPNTKFYGRLSIISQYFFNINKIFDISKNCFFPIPKVNSTFLKFIPHKLFPNLLFDVNILSKITFEAFNKRRKILRHSLKKFFTEKDLFNLDINSQLRPENLSVKQYCLLTDFLIKKQLY